MYSSKLYLRNEGHKYFCYFAVSLTLTNLFPSGKLLSRVEIVWIGEGVGAAVKVK